MFDSVEELAGKLASTGYFIDPVMTKVVFLATQLQNRRAWAQAMNAVVTAGSGSGAVLFQSFPQEVVDAFAEMTGGQRVRVRMPKTVNGYAWFDDEQRAFLVERRSNPEGPDCEKRVLVRVRWPSSSWISSAAVGEYG